MTLRSGGSVPDSSLNISPIVCGEIIGKGAKMAEKLAIDGGPRAVTNDLAGWPRFDEKAIKAVQNVFRSGKVNYWTGPKGMEFERKFAHWQGSKYAVSASSGTAALHIALSALGIGPGDEVIVPSYTFIASSFSVVQAGAIPRFADVNIGDHCISVESAEKLVNKRTRAIIDDRDPLIGGELGLRSQKVLAACYESARSGKIVEVGS